MLRSLFIVAGILLGTHAFAEEKRPNILWIFVDDMSANFSCYGETTIETPNVDGMAQRSTKFTRAFVTCPVCSPCRSALITGMYQTTIGAHNHRSGRGQFKIELPEKVTPVPKLFQQAGYYTSNSGPLNEGKPKPGKTDYNFEWDKSMYDGIDWSGRKEGQPFFAQIQLPGGKYRHGKNWPVKAKRELGTLTDPNEVTLPPYYPNNPVLKQDWAEYLDTCRYTDKQVGLILDRLKNEGVLDNTIVFFMTDHGISHARGKQFLYEEGIHVPFVVQGPGIEAGKVRDDLVLQIDMTASSLAFAGIGVPDWMQGKDLWAKDYEPREWIVSARDRCDETVDRIRCVRNERYKYIRNFYPERPMLQPNRYKDNKPILIELRKLHAEGKLSDMQERILFAPTRPKEELYDLRTDPHALNNLADDPDYFPTLEAMRNRLEMWIEKTDDQGATPEPPKVYDAEMKVYLGNKKSKQNEILRENIAQQKEWMKQGK